MKRFLIIKDDLFFLENSCYKRKPICYDTEYKEMSEERYKTIKNNSKKEDVFETENKIEFLKQWRKLREMTQEEVCKEYRIPIGTYRNWEQGRREIPEIFIRLIVQESSRITVIYKDKEE